MDPQIDTNRAPQVNPSTATLHLSNSGSDWDWAVFALMLFADLILIAWTYTRPNRGARLFNYLGIIILTTSALNYWNMASNLGSTPIQVQYLRGRAPGTTRAIWYTRYIAWFIIAPLLALMLLLLTGLNASSIIMILFMVDFAVVAGLVGALTHSSYKWGYFVFGLLALIFIWGCFFGQGWRSAGFIGPDAKLHYLRGAAFLSFFWALYPICWGLSEGGNVISPTGEMVFYGILDIFTQVVFIFLLLWGLRDLEFDRLGLSPLKASESAYAGPGMTNAPRAGGATTGGAPAATGGAHTAAGTTTGQAASAGQTTAPIA